MILCGNEALHSYKFVSLLSTVIVTSLAEICHFRPLVTSCTSHLMQHGLLPLVTSATPNLPPPLICATHYVLPPMICHLQPSATCHRCHLSHLPLLNFSHMLTSIVCSLISLFHRLPLYTCHHVSLYLTYVMLCLLLDH